MLSIDPIPNNKREFVKEIPHKIRKCTGIEGALIFLLNDDGSEYLIVLQS